MKNNRAKKILSFVLAASMVFAAMAPTMAYAAETEGKDFNDAKIEADIEQAILDEHQKEIDQEEKYNEAWENYAKEEQKDEIIDAEVIQPMVTKPGDTIEDENLLVLQVRINNKEIIGDGEITVAFEAEDVADKDNELNGKVFKQKAFIKDGKVNLDVNVLFESLANKNLVKNVNFTMTVDEIKFEVGDGTKEVLNPEEIEIENVNFKSTNDGIQIESLENVMNLDFYTAIEKLTLKVLENGLDAKEADFDAFLEVRYEDEDDKPVYAKKDLEKITTDDKGKVALTFDKFSEDNKKELLGDAKYTLTVTNDEGQKVEVTFETNAFGRITKVNGNDAVYNDKDDELKDIKVEFDKKYTNTTRFEIEKYDDEKGFAIEKIEILPLIRKDQKSAYRRDNDGNYMVEKDAESIKVDGKDLLDAKLDGTKFDINKKELKTALDDAKSNTAINLGKTGEQNIVALRFTEEARKNNIDADKQQRTRDIFINVDDLKDKDIIKLVNPLADFELEVLVKGGNPSKAIEGATVEILPAELDTLGVAQYGKAIATGTTKANGKVKFEGVNLETIIKHAALNRKDSNFVNENAVKETVLPFQIVVKDAKGFEAKEYVLTQKDIVVEKATIDLNTAKTVEDIRIAGANRYETALKVAMDLKADGSRNVVIASGKNYADALVGARYANYQNAVLLLVENEIDKNVMEYLDMATKQVTLLGGNASVAPGVQEELAKKFDVNRIYGTDRYETSVNVAKAMKDVENVFVASGENYADALVASAAANRLGNTAILLTEKAEMPSVVKTYLDATAENYKKAFVFGGEGSVSERVMAQVNEAVTAERVKGADRDETAVAVAKKFFAEDAKAVVASGANYADALVAGTMNQPVLLVTGGVNDAVKNYLNDQIMNAKVIGGAGSVSDAIVDEVVNNLK